MNPHPTSTDTTSTDTTSTDTTSTGSAVTITEIAEFLQQLRALSRPGAADPSRDADPTRDAGDATAERATFLARKADLLARIAAAPSPTAPPPTAPSPTDGDPT
jgi:hypothetical protein